MNEKGAHGMKPRLIAMGFDDNYLFPALVTLFSARRGYAKELKVLIAHDGECLSADSISLIRETCLELKIDVSFKEIDFPDFLGGSGHLSRMSWARIILMSEVSEQFLWLDADLILQSGWESLLFDGHSLQAAGLAAALDSNFTNTNVLNTAYVVAGEAYINDGVLLVDPNALDTRVLQRLGEGISRYSELGFEWLDQDVINFSLEGKGGVLPQSFNRQVPIHKVKKTTGFILHFTSDAKPWSGPWRLLYFYSFSVRFWNEYASALVKFVSNKPTLQSSLKRARKAALRAERLSMNTGPFRRKVLLGLARIIWR